MAERRTAAIAKDKWTHPVSAISCDNVHRACQENESARYVSNHSDKNENKIFLIYKEIQMGSVAMSYMTNSNVLLI